MLRGLDNLLHVSDLFLVRFGKYDSVARLPIHRERSIPFTDMMEVCKKNIRPLENRIDKMIIGEPILPPNCVNTMIQAFCQKKRIVTNLQAISHCEPSIVSDSELHVVEQDEDSQVDLQKILRLIVQNFLLQLLQQFLSQRDEKLVDCDVIDLEVHDRSDRGFAVVWTPFIHIWFHAESFGPNNRPWCFDDATSNPEFQSVS